ncbi:MAG: TonB-dependent receptor [Candidatus Schekmanbacteria bacterium]|nr:TonB-dependent receptor [Candidatus Schekmanbacteria bacterium]
MQKFFHCLIIAVCLVISISYLEVEAKENPKDVELGELNVTATRTERTLAEIPAGVSTVSKEDIKNTRMLNLKEALNGMAGVQTETKNGGYDTRLIIRGAGLKARYGVREIMVLMDGVPITDPDGLTRLDFVDTQLVEQIDVVKGPNSTLYGANAGGGVINVITKSPYEEPKSLKLGYGSNDTQVYNLIYGTHIDNTFFTLSASRRSTDSWRKWNEFDTDQFSLKLGQFIDDKTGLEAMVSYSQSDFQLPGSLTKAQFDSDITQRTADIWRQMGRYSQVVFSNIKLEKQVKNLTFKPLVYYQQWEHFHPVTGMINDGGAYNYGADFQTDVKHQIAGGEATLTGGVTAQVDGFSADKFTYRDVTIGSNGKISATLTDKKGERAETAHNGTSKYGLYLQESLRPSDKWIIDLGVRYDLVTFDLDTDTTKEFNYSTGKYKDVNKSVERQKEFKALNPRLGVVYSLTDIYNLYANFSTGFQTPQTQELTSNPNLDPLKVYNYETGVKARWTGGHSLDLSLFYMQVKDEIVQVVQPGPVYEYQNAGESEKKGVELTGRYQLLPGLVLGGSYTYSNFKFKEFTEVRGVGNEDRSGNRYPYIPQHQYSLFAQYKHESGLKFKVDTNTWGRYYVDNANSEQYNGYDFLTNALIGYEQGNWDLSFTAYNLFDQRYAMEVTSDGNATKYNPGAPRTFMGNVTYKF